MSTPWFFLSYASIGPDHDARVTQFYFDLVRELRATAGLDESNVPAADIGFFAKTGSTAGDIWTDKLVAKLRSCRVLICLYSGKYFRSAPCGKEFAVFNSRLDAYAEENPDKPRPSLIVPVLWIIPNGFPKMMPDALSEIDYKSEHLNKLVAANGLYYMQSREKHKDDYEEFVSWLARTIYSVAEPPLKSLKNPPDFASVWSPFHELPPVPENLKASAVSGRAIDLSWSSKPEEREGDREGFRVIRRADADGEDFSELSAKVGPAATSFRDGGLAPSTSYTYRVRAFGPGGYSGYSNEDTATTAAQPPPTTAPSTSRQTGGSPLPAPVPVPEPSPEPVPVLKPEPVPLPKWLPYLLITLALSAVVAAFFFKGGSVPPIDSNVNANNSNVTPSAAPGRVLRKTIWSDAFNNAGTEGASAWAQGSLWDVSGGVRPFWKGHVPNGWLVVQGEGEGIVKAFDFDDFEAIFPVEFGEGGTKAGWILRAQGDKQTGYTGYCFVLERAGDAFQLVGYWGQPQHRPVGPLEPQRIPITQFGKDSPDDITKTRDYIQVGARAEGDTFFFVFQLMNPDTEDKRADLGECFPASAQASPAHAAQGQVGFFAEGDGGFRVDTLDVYPLPQNARHVECKKPSPPPFTVK
jgi:hypothetical protein